MQQCIFKLNKETNPVLGVKHKGYEKVFRKAFLEIIQLYLRSTVPFKGVTEAEDKTDSELEEIAYLFQTPEFPHQ